MAEVFISYHEESAGALAGKIAEKLDNAGISCWYARRDMPFGGNFPRVIPDQINACKVFLLLLDESVYHSDHIENEVGIAFSRRNKKRNLQILPLVIGDFAWEGWIEYYLIHTQSERFPAEPDEQRLQGLVRRIAKLLDKTSAPQPTTPKKEPKPSSKEEPTPPVPTPPPKPPKPKEEPKPEPPPVKIIKRGECGDNVTFTLDEKGVLTISGKGSMRNFYRAAPWANECKTISRIVIQNDVDTIGACAFKDCTGLTSITIPHNVETIERSAFENCAGLISVTILHGVTTIGESAFSGCKALGSVTIPDSVKQIGRWAFLDCENLANVSIPANVYKHPDAFPDSVTVKRRA